MRISKYNHEGYSDPTPFEAFKSIKKKPTSKPTVRRQKQQTFRPLVYICSPYAGDVKANTVLAKAYCRFAVEQGAIPIASHLLFPQFMDDDNKSQRDLALFMATVLLTKCHEVWVFGRKISTGMATEIYKAECRQMPIRYFNTDCTPVTPSTIQGSAPEVRT